MRLFAAILTGKLIAILSRTLKLGGGSAAPGLYALKVDPDLVEKLARKIPKSLVITGTNGKTTTARMVAHLAKESGLKVIRNHTGSNLERGIASALILKSSILNLKSSYDLGIWELDEAAFNSVTPKLKPDIVVFLNVFRDQLDRYGEVDSVVKRWEDTLSKLGSKTTVLVNGDDANTAKLKDFFKGKVETFGVEDFKIEGESLEKSSHHKLDFEATNVRLDGLNGSEFRLTINDSRLTIRLPIPGIYHIYDAVAALATAHHVGLPIHELADSLAHFQPAFGRVEKLPFGYIFLIKNPAGATQVFETIAPQIKPDDKFLIALNDNLADGTDVSWIWDAQFELLPNHQTIISGTRAQDLAVRLKYSGFEAQKLIVIPSLENALKEARKGLKGQLFILPTYTALLELQGILTKQGIKDQYWQES